MSDQVNWTSLVCPISDETGTGCQQKSEEEDQLAGSGLTEDLLGLPRVNLQDLQQ